MRTKLQALGLAVAAVTMAMAGLPSNAHATPIELFSETFTDFTGSGFASSPAAGQLDSDLWRAIGLSDGTGTFGGTHTTGDFARGLGPVTAPTGGVTTGGVYAFDVGNGGGDTGLGIQADDTDFTPGSFELRLVNTTGSTISKLEVRLIPLAPVGSTGGGLDATRAAARPG